MKNEDDFLKRISDMEKEMDVKIRIEKSKYDSLLEQILLFSKDFWIPSYNGINDAINIETNSWFSIQEQKSKTINPIVDSNIKIEKSKNMISCEKIRMRPNKKQRRILIHWMNAYIRMYNETIKFMKKRKLDKLPTIIDWKRMRTDHLKSIKQQIINQSNLKHLPYKTKVNSHILDGAIQDACSKLKSCLTNLRNGNIKHFRLRYLKQSKDTKILKIEKYFIDPNKNTFCSSVFKDSFILKRKVKNGQGEKWIDFRLSEISKDFTIHYNRKTNEFTLLNPVKTEQKKLHNNVDTVSLDPGLCKFLTGYTTNKCINIGEELITRIIKYIKKIDNVNNNKKVCLSKRRKVERRCYRKIENIIDDMHWKSINYLTNNFGNILIGNLSTKNIIQNNSKNNLNGYIKRIASLMKLYQFKQRLAFKCKQRKIGYTEIDEAYTSKTCTSCGCLKTNLGKARTYKCDFCNLKIDRDYGGARNIFLNSIDN